MVTSTSEIFTLSLHDALPICERGASHFLCRAQSLTCLSPGGTSDNSPAFQRRELSGHHTSPEGTAEQGTFFQPSLRDSASHHSNPAVSCRAIFNGSFGTKPRSAPTQKMRCALVAHSDKRRIDRACGHDRLCLLIIRLIH